MLVLLLWIVSLQLAGEALAQNPFYQQQVSDFLRCNLAMTEAKAELRETLQHLEADDISKKSLEATFLRLPQWYENLRPSTVTSIVKQLLKAVEHYTSAAKVQVEDFAKIDQPERQSLVQDLYDLAKSGNTLSKAIGHKVQGLATVGHGLETLYHTAVTSDNELRLREAVELLLRSFAIDDVVKRIDEQAAFIAAMSRERVETTRIASDYRETLHKVVCKMALSIAKAEELVKTTVEIAAPHLQGLMASTEKLHKMLGSFGATSVRQTLLKVAASLMPLQTSLAKAGSPKQHLKDAGLADIPPDTLHLIVEVVEKGDAFIKEIASTILEKVVGGVKEHQAKAHNLSGSKDIPVWAAKIPKEATWEQFAAACEKTLLKPDYAEKVKAAKQLLDKDCVQESPTRVVKAFRLPGCLPSFSLLLAPHLGKKRGCL